MNLSGQSSEPPMPARPTWPYTIGMLGALAFGFGAFVEMGMAVNGSGSRGWAQLAMLALTIGGVVLGIAWIGVFLHRRSGAGTIIGSFAVPLAALYIYTQRSSWENQSAHAMMWLLAHAAFAMGHLFARGLKVARVCAGIALLALSVAAAAAGGKVGISSGNSTLLALLAFGGLGAACIFVATELLQMRDAPEHQHDL